MSEKSRARLKLTLACDKACKYCINKDQDYQNRWVQIEDIQEVKWSDFRTIIISGGEPTMDLRLRSVCRGLRIFAGEKPMIYLQTNGSGLTKQLIMDPDVDHSIDGIGLSVHNLAEFQHMLPRWLDIVKVKPIRLYFEEGTMEDDVHEVLGFSGAEYLFQYRPWKAGCLDHSEQVFLLHNWEHHIRP